MNRKIVLPVFLVLMMVTGMSPVYGAQPPNPTTSDGQFNTAGGTGTLLNNTGYSNTGFGNYALTSNTSGGVNTAFGNGALYLNATGGQNTAYGAYALHDNTTANNNSASGVYSQYHNTTGNYNTADGSYSLFSNTTGAHNTASGAQALYKNAVDNYNTAIGVQALYNKTSGGNNLALGYRSGVSLKTGNYNIYLDNPGTANESKAIRIGNNQTRTFIAGIRGKKTGVANAIPVMIDSKGQLGTIKSSARFKKDIADMAAASQALYKLRPVTYRYKVADDNGDNPLEYGLIAEEVAKVYPDLVAYGADGQIETVQYHKLTPMLLNELIQVNNSLQTAVSKSASLAGQLKAEQIKNQQLAKEVAGLKAQSLKVVALEQQVAALQTQAKAIETLTARLTRLEAGQVTALNH